MKILSIPKGAAGEYGRWSINAYLGCPHGCRYCYLQSGPGSKTLGGPTAQLKAGIVSEEHAYHVAMAEILENRDQIVRDGGLFFTFTSDPCIKETRDLNFTIAHDAMMMHIPVTFLTKDAVCNVIYRHVVSGREMQLPVPCRDFFGQYAAFGWTLTGCDDQEPGAATNQERLAAMHGFYAYGFKVWASLEPVIDYDATVRMFRRALSAGCSHFKIGLLTKNNRVVRSHYNVKYLTPQSKLNSFIDDIVELNQGHNATIYWKKSIRSLTDLDLNALPNSVGADYSMFKPKYHDDGQKD